MKATVREHKERVVDELADKLERSRMAILTDYRGLKVSDLNALTLRGNIVPISEGETYVQIFSIGPVDAEVTTTVERTGPNGSLRNPDEPTRVMLARALRPFILRRTKEQVAADLPAKYEQTLYCELEGPQRKFYDELRLHYRQALLDQIDREGLGRSKIQILEGLKQGDKVILPT